MKDRDENSFADELGTKRGRIMSKHPSVEDEPPMKVKKGDKDTTTATSVCTPGAKEATQEARLRQKGHGRSDADLPATVAMGGTDDGCPPAPTQARMRRQARPWKSTADADTEGHGRSMADSSSGTATGHGFVNGHRPRIASASVARGAAAKRVEQEDEEEEERQADLWFAWDGRIRECRAVLATQPWTLAVRLVCGSEAR